MRHGLVLAALAFVACADPNDQGARLASIRREHRKPTQAPQRYASTSQVPASEPVSAVKVTEAPAERCARTRPQRVQNAKDAIVAFRDRMKEIAPLVKWAVTHKCELRDTTGTLLYSSTKEAGGIRVKVTRGHPDEIVCDVANVPEGLTVDLMQEIAVLDATDEDAVMFSTWPECDDAEKPSLRVRYNDAAGQRAILALP